MFLEMTASNFQKILLAIFRKFCQKEFSKCCKKHFLKTLFFCFFLNKIFICFKFFPRIKNVARKFFVYMSTTGLQCFKINLEVLKGYPYTIKPHNLCKTSKFKHIYNNILKITLNFFVIESRVTTLSYVK